ncbi:hypothetical protein [Haloglomus litoreum]|uniref:hypothetical protein n=1 Tax=Haloglomus litoreum TaxID=3034026 RepID=UPI0023E76215|nr:hypothetical protein [Haloglomus sp. DT116]
MEDSPGPQAFVEYCRTQAALLSGRVQQMGEAADELLDEVDEELDALRGDLDDATEGTATPPSTDDPDRPEPGAGEAADAADAAESAVSTVERKQTLVEAKQARMHAFNDLAGGYADLAEALDDVEDGATALERVVAFEVDHDAPAYFPDRETLAETVAGDGDGRADDADAEE